MRTRFSLVGVLCGLLLPMTTFAASYCVTSTPAHEEGIANMLQYTNNGITQHNLKIASTNQERAKAIPPLPPLDLQPLFPSVETYIIPRLQVVLDEQVRTSRVYRDEQYRRLGEQASDAIKTQIKNLLSCGQVTCP